ncbi:16795_t:CDS:10 [Acaulospora morrowiae]|uniref:16795_t:CDS:1 n=1 Tax=Acaulospora morrowiae TaxID=94023 RepID=A0A9N8WHF0_9GLOM|nr:16795_t:CDS:10 [Acaulospora morrowiae]
MDPKTSVGVCWLFVFPLEQYSKHTYISENALLPGQVNTYYNWPQVFEAMAYRDNIKSILNLSSLEKAEHIEDQLKRSGFKTAKQNFTVVSSGRVISGVNVFGVLNSPRADGTEALVLSAPWISKDGVTININGIAAALSIGKFFKNTDYTYWSKDIIILITDGGEAGVQAWLESYHDHQLSDIKASPLLLRSGAIQAAVNLDFPGVDDYKALGLFFGRSWHLLVTIAFYYMYDYSLIAVVFQEGLNGQLPNLDLINTIVRICRISNNIPISLHDSGHFYTHNDVGDYQSSFYNLLTTMKYQALGHPTGSHGLFFRYKIDAVTLYGLAEAPNASPYSFMEIGPMVESTFRSLNNLLEHLHQSFFFYLLPSPERYISIGSYLPPAILLAVELWAETGDDTAKTISQELQKQPSDPSNVKAHIAPLAYMSRPREILFPVTALVMAHFSGLIIFFVVKNHFIISKASYIFGIDVFTGLNFDTLKIGFSEQFAGFVAIVSQSFRVMLDSECTGGYLITLAISVNISIVVSMSLIIACHNRTHHDVEYLARQQLQNLQPAAPDWIVLKSFTLAFTAMIISCLSVLNFSLAIFVSSMVIMPFSLFQPTSIDLFSADLSSKNLNLSEALQSSSENPKSIENVDSPKSGSFPEKKNSAIEENSSLISIIRQLFSKDLLNILQLLVLIIISPPGILIMTGTNLDEFLSWIIMEYELFGSYLLPFSSQGLKVPGRFNNNVIVEDNLIF